MGSERVLHELATKQQWQQQYFILHMYHIFFIHSSVDGYLGCFHVMAIRLLPCPAAMNNECMCPFGLWLSPVRAQEWDG